MRVILFDDTSLSDDLQEVLKSATSSFHEPIEHRTVTADRQLRVCSIPERCVWWLAKVENPGDDQVMNRMLTVWIDDSAEQDRRVLEHLKETEAGVYRRGDDPDVLTCRALWSVLKQQRIFVRIPFARRIQFSNVANRRNPAMLFDLIKCHAALRFLQREGKETGDEIRIEATRQDFDAACPALRRDQPGGWRAGLEDDPERSGGARHDCPDGVGVVHRPDAAAGDRIVVSPGPADPAGLHREGHGLLRAPREMSGARRGGRDGHRREHRDDRPPARVPLPVRRRALPGMGGRARGLAGG